MFRTLDGNVASSVTEFCLRMDKTIRLRLVFRGLGSTFDTKRRGNAVGWTKLGVRDWDLGDWGWSFVLGGASFWALGAGLNAN